MLLEYMELKVSTQIYDQFAEECDGVTKGGLEHGSVTFCLKMGHKCYEDIDVGHISYN